MDRNKIYLTNKNKTIANYFFPFGQPSKEVEQKDNTIKKHLC